MVEESATNNFKKGDRVIVMGFDLGMNTWGGFGEYIRVPKDWVLKMPQGLTSKEVAIYGTAGFTAGQCVEKLVASLKPKDGDIVVSGATGGVGTMSVGILSKIGYKVVAITGKSENDFLVGIGASEILERKTFSGVDKTPMHKGVYAGAIDTVGGNILENIIKSVKMYGVIACCGNVAGGNLNTTVYPFILRGISLVGLTSQSCPMDNRKIIWEKLSSVWKPKKIMELYEEVSLEKLPEKIDLILRGIVKGRVIVKIGG
ncbi:quinone oxidoreductase [Elysia marginata]|uniref:Quinone oxidoreductase n=1 Tax=Elysia marginata TaxID=1093978 RepID=A0AAV4F018_9GAST|nr:quinone oxidoreductase [Elysia marginata]